MLLMQRSARWRGGEGRNVRPPPPRRRRRRRTIYNDKHPIIATVQSFTASAKIWLIVLCYGFVLYKMKGLLHEYSSAFDDDTHHCPANVSAPICCQFDHKCAVARRDQGITLQCGYTEDEAFPILLNFDHPLSEPYFNHTGYDTCCEGHNDDRVMEGAIECCDTSLSGDNCEVGTRRCRVALRESIGCCAVASVGNATGWTTLTAAVWWRPLILTLVNMGASSTMAIRAGIAYSRDVLDLSVISPSALFTALVTCSPPMRFEVQGCWLGTHAAAMATVVLVIVWAAFIPYWWDADATYYDNCHGEILSDWSHDLRVYSSFWRIIVRVDFALLAIHFLCDLSLTKACAH